MDAQLVDSANNNRPLIVVVEGSADEMCLISDALQSGSTYRVLGYVDPEKAYSRIIEERPALTIIDSHIPSKGGIELIQKISDEDSLEAMPLIAVVTGTSEMDHTGARADVFLTRPFDTETLLQTVHTLIKGKAL